MKSVQKKGGCARRNADPHLGAPARINKGEDQTRQITRDFHIRVANCAEVEGRIFGHSL
jgi:hypothetical protein